MNTPIHVWTAAENDVVRKTLLLQDRQKAAEAAIQAELKIPFATIKQQIKNLRQHPWRTNDPWEQEEDDCIMRELNKPNRHLKRLPDVILGRTNAQIAHRITKLTELPIIEQIKPTKKYFSHNMKKYLDVIMYLTSDQRKYGDMAKIARQSAIDDSNLSRWCNEVTEAAKANDGFPDEESAKKTFILDYFKDKTRIEARLLSPEQDQALAVYIKGKLNRSLSLEGMRMTALRFLTKEEQIRIRARRTLAQYFPDADSLERFIAETDVSDLEAHMGPFIASWAWCKAFMKRHQLALKAAHEAKRGVVDADDVTRFLDELELAYRLYGPARIANMDETKLILNPPPGKIIGLVGVDTDTLPLWDSKAGVTILGTVMMSGEKKLPWLIAAGSGTECQEKYECGERFVVCHTPTGWVNVAVMLNYIEYAHHHIFNRHRGALVVDSYGCHICPVIKARADAYGIMLIAVPKNGTALYQPLDIGVYGPLKSVYGKAARAKRTTKGKMLTYADATHHFSRAWGSIKEAIIRDAWQKIQGLRFQIDLTYNPDAIPHEIRADASYISSVHEAQQTPGVQRKLHAYTRRAKPQLRKTPSARWVHVCEERTTRDPVSFKIHILNPPRSGTKPLAVSTLFELCGQFAEVRLPRPGTTELVFIVSAATPVPRGS